MKHSHQLTMVPRFILLVLISSVACFKLDAQTDSSLVFFPLQVNDFWQYRFHYYDCCCNYNISSYFTVRVTGDTVLPDGLKYEELETDPPQLFPTQYLRVDSATGNVYKYSGDTSVGDYLLDSLLATVGSSFKGTRGKYGGPITCAGIDTATVLGMRTIVKQFMGEGIFYRLAYGIGLTQVDTMIFQCGTWDSRSVDLCYARIGGQEYGTFVGLINQSEIAPGSFTIVQNYPNPFNPSTTIRYGLPHRSAVQLSVYNTLGEQVALLVQGEQEAGFHEVQFNGSGLASGIYFYQLTAGENVLVRRMLLLR